MPETPLWEVFIRPRRGLSHTHVGSLHAPDAELALRNARDLYTRRQEGVSIWVVPAAAITASSPDEKDPFFDPAGYAYPSGFPRGATRFVSPKVIVARAFPGPGSGDQGQLPFVGDEFHGTHVAGIAAGNAGTKAPPSDTEG